MKKITFFLLFGLISLFGNAQVGLIENFDSGLVPPAGWTFTGYFGTVVEVCDGFSQRDQLSETSTTGNLTSPNLAGQSNGTDLTISFDYKIVDWSAAVDATPPGWGELLVNYSINDGADWITIGTINDENHVTSNVCAEMQFVIPGASLPNGSDFKLQFVGNWAAGDYYIYLDNVSATQEVVGPPSCVNLTTPVNGATGVSINTDLAWTTATNIPQGYNLTVGTTSGGNDIADTDTGLSTVYDLPTLEYGTTYYVNIVPYNANGPALDCAEFSFTTGADPNAPVDCSSGAPINVEYCYTNNETTTWNFQSSDGSPLNIFFNAGYMEGCCDDITIYDGADDTAPVLYGGNNGGNLAGLSVNTTGDSMYIVIDSDTSVSCESTGNTPMDFDVSCIDLTAVPNCNSELTSPVNGATNVDVASSINWSPASVIVDGYFLSIGTTPGGTDILDNEQLVGNVLSYSPGILPYESTIYVSIVPYNSNGNAENCTEYSFSTEVNPYQCEAEDQCLFTFTLTDSFGDGWNGNTMTISQDGLEIEIIGSTFTSGSSAEIQLPLCDGLPFELFWNSGGSFAGEVGITVTDPFGEEVFAMSNGNGSLQNSLLYSQVVNCTPPTCPKPIDVAIGEINMNNAEISWTEVGDATTWEVIVQPLGSGYPSGDEAEIVQTTDNPYVYEGLDSGTQYEVYVRAICAEDDLSDWQGPVAFDTTICDAVDQCLYTFSLTDSFGDGWNGNTMSVLQNGIEVGILGPTFTSGAGPVEVQVALCDGVPFELFWNSGGSFAGEVGVSITDPFEDVVFTMPSGNGSLQNSSLYTDVVNCTPPTCPEPTDVAIGEINMNDVEVSWTENGEATTWEVIVQPLGSGYPSGDEAEIVQTTENPFVYEGLDSGTQYEVYVRAVCAEDDLSDWHGPVAFDTTICNAEDQCLYTFVMTDSFGDGWNGNTMSVLQNGIEVGIIGPTFTSGAGPVEVQVALCDGVPFELFWNAGGSFAGEVGVVVLDAFEEDLFTMPSGNGSLQNSSLYTDVVNCTPPTCPRPIDLTIENITPNSVEVSWTEIGTATTWDVIVQPVGSGYPTGDEAEIVQTTDNPMTYEGLDAGVEYEIYVRAVCGEDDLSDWRGPITFNTPILVDCEAADIINTTFCYESGNNAFVELYSFQSTSGFPLNIEFNAGYLESCCDFIRIENGEGGVLYEGNNGGNLAGLSLMSDTNTLVIYLDADGSVSCSSSGNTPWDFDVWCQTCIPQTASFDVVNGDCSTDPNNPVFEVEVDLSDMGDAETLTVADNQGSDPIEVSETGILILGPYPANANVIVTVTNADDGNCVVESNPLTFLCPPPPNPCSIVFAGDDQEVDCDNPETELSGYFHLYGNDTSSYEINAIDTCPTPPVDGATPTSVNSDDIWSGVIDLGFEFCFYGGTYDQVIIGSNGVISFEVGYANTGNGWAFDPDDTLPNATNMSITEANIFGVGHDIDPSVCGSIDYVVLGSAPYRQFVVNFNAVCHFGSQCNSNETTSQIVLHESSNNIDIHVLSKPTCTSWNDGLAVIGLQSIDDTQGISPPGRNMGVWTVTEPESWRFSPAGDPLYTLEWLDEEGTVVGTEQNITVSPTQSTTYTLAVTYDLCTGGEATVTDEVHVTFNGGDSDSSFELTPSCNGATAEITGDEGGTFAFDPEPGDDAEIDEVTGEITNGTPGATYSVTYTIDSECPSTTTVEVTLLPGEDASFTLDSTCNEATATVTGDAGGTFAFNPEPGDDAEIDAETGAITNGVIGTTYTVQYTTSGECPSSSTQSITLEDNDSPEAVCNNIVVSLDESGNYTLSEDDIAAIGSGSSDTCGIDSMMVSQDSFTCDNIGDNEITLTVVDVNGNEATCTATVTVEGIEVEVSITETPLSDYCQGVILTAESEGAVSYAWTTGEDTQIIEVVENGVYGVTVTNASGCTGSIEYEVTSISEGTSISDYTIVASNRVFLHGNNTVETGAVGVTSANGSIRLHQGSHVVGTAEAANITLNQGSTVGNEVEQAADPQVPEFMYNTLSNSDSPSVNVASGETMTLDGEVYDLIRVQAGATVVFSQSNLFVNKIQTWDGASIEFESCANVYVNDMFILAKNGVINSYGNRVLFFVNNDIHIEKGSHVSAIMYTTGQLLAKGSNVNSNNPESTYMTGLFIAERVHGDQNVIWNTADICEPCPVYEGGNQYRSNFEVVSWPNPSDTKFNLKIRTQDFSTSARVDVFDINGKLVHTTTLEPGREINFGSELEGGIYMVKVNQGKNTKIVRLVKY